MPRPRPKPAPKPTIKVKVEYAHEDWEVDIIVPTWAMHKLTGGEPSDRFEEEGGESMWELYVKDQGERAAEKAFAAKKAKLDAEEKTKNDARLRCLKESFDTFDEDGSGSLEAEEVLLILTRMTGKGCQLTLDDAKEFIAEFDRDGDGHLDVNEFIVAMGVMSDATDENNDGEADMKAGGGNYDGNEDAFAKKLAAGESINVAGVASGDIKSGVEAARRLQS